MSSACPDCTSRIICVKHAAELARRSVDSYVPQALRAEDWEPIAGFIRALAHDLHPKDDRRAVEAMRTLSQVVSWAHREGLPLDRERIFTPDVIDRYIAVGAAHLSEPSRATRRADLRRFSRTLTRKAPWEPEPPRMRGGYSIVPYTDAEVARLLEVSQQQRTPVQARRLEALLALGLGVGVYPKEAWSLTTEDVVVDQGYVCVRIPGEHARTVPVTAPHDEVIARIAADDPGSTILGFIAPQWDRSRLSHLLQRAELPADCPPLRTHRLRATWALAHLRAGMQINDVMNLAGVSSWKMLGYLAAFAPATAWSELLPKAARK